MAQSQTARLIELFKKRGKLTNRYMADHVCLRYSARLAELRAEGHSIVANRLKDGLFEYIYTPDDEADLDELLEVLQTEEKAYNTEKMAKEWL